MIAEDDRLNDNGFFSGFLNDGWLYDDDDDKRW